MYKYEVQFKYNTDTNGGCTSKTVQITFPKRVYAFTDVYGKDGKGRNEILIKAVDELGLDQNMVEAIDDRNRLDGSWYKLKYLGEVENSDNENSKKATNSKKSFFSPLWAFPFKLIWLIIKLIFKLVTLGMIKF